MGGGTPFALSGWKLEGDEEGTAKVEAVWGQGG